MSADSPIDPAAMFREMLTQWETMANELGGNLLKSGEFARAMHGANTAVLKAREVGHDMMDRALSAANMPSKGDIVDLSARLHRVEEAVQRIEALLRAALTTQGTGDAPSPATLARPRPTRTRQPGHKSSGKAAG